MNCPSCHGAMETLSLRAHLGTPLDIDACWECRLIWFDAMESVALAPQSVIALFKRIHGENRDVLQIVSMKPDCPRCRESLALTRDIARNGSFSYHRCLRGHGRLISFTQFLREKNFIRSLNPAERQTLLVTVKQIRCSSCGAPVNLETDTACTHCGSAISVLDEQAVQKALDEYASRAASRPQAPDVRGAGMATQRWPASPQSYSPGAWSSGNMFADKEAGAVLVDLVCVGIAALFE